VNTISGNQIDGRRRRRRHGDEFKASAVTACMQPGVSIAAVAMTHGINANLLRRWVNDAEMKPVARAGIASAAVTPIEPNAPRLTPSFIPMEVPTPTPAPAPTSAPPQDIHIELRRNAMTVTVTWPASAASECATWMRELLR
jgi:transposase